MNILITGGTGTFGKAFLRRSLRENLFNKHSIFSRDELKQHDLRNELCKEFPPEMINKRVRFFIGDVRDKDRLLYATQGQDIVIHAAALKHVNLCEYNPQEAVKTNVFGTQNVVDACIQNNVQKLLCLSTDKSVNPINLYGATKLILEKLALNSNYLSSADSTKISVVRYGNVIASRGSVIPIILEHKDKSIPFSLTDANMTRFWLSISDAVNLVLFGLKNMKGMEIFIPKMKSLTMQKLIEYLAPELSIVTTGLRPGEKFHEAMISSHELNRTYIASDKVYVIYPEIFPGITNVQFNYTNKVDFDQYTSDSVEFLTKEEFFSLMETTC